MTFKQYIEDEPYGYAEEVYLPMTFTTNLSFGDKVVADGDRALVGTVVAFKYLFAGHPLVEISYWHDGDLKYALIEESRLTPAPL